MGEGRSPPEFGYVSLDQLIEVGLEFIWLWAHWGVDSTEVLEEGV